MDYAGSAGGNVEFKESIGLNLVVKFDKWLEGLAKSEKAMNEFGAEAVKAAQGLTTTFVKAQTGLEKSAGKITGVFKSIRNEIAKTAIVWGTASLAMAQHATTIQRSMFALEKTAMSTGRSFSAQMKLIEDSIGGVASRADLLSSSTSLMSTALDTTQMKQFLDVVKDTSAALGTDFSANVEHAVASLKTMDTRLLANMGIMVDMETLTKKMATKFPGADPETLSLQQKQAALLDVITDKTKMFAGANKEMAEKGLFAWAEFKENLKDISIAIGTMFIPAWNSVAKVLASVTKSIKNFFENENVQKFGVVIAKTVVPAMMLLLAAFTALTPIIGIVMKLLTVAPFIAITMAIIQFTKVLVGTGSVTQAFVAFGGALKNIGDPISLAWKSFKALKDIIPLLTIEMNRMKVAGVGTGKYFTDLSVAIKNVMPKIRETLTKYGVPQEAKNMTMLPFLKDQYNKLGEAAGGAIGPVKGLNQQIIAFGSAMKSFFLNLRDGLIGGIVNIKRMGVSLYELFGKSMIGAMAGFRIAFAALLATIRAGVVATGVAIKALLAYVAPIVLIGLAIEGAMFVIDKLKNKYIEAMHGSAELRDEVEALKKEYNALAAAAGKAGAALPEVTRRRVIEYAKEKGLGGKDITNEQLMATGIAEAQTAGGRVKLREAIDLSNAMDELRKKTTSASIEFKGFTFNIEEVAKKSKDVFSAVKTYSSGLKIQEQALESMIGKSMTMNKKDMDKYIADLSKQRKDIVAQKVADYKVMNIFADAKDLEQVRKRAGAEWDEYIKTLKDPKKTQELLDINRQQQSKLAEFLKSDNMTAEVVASLQKDVNLLNTLNMELISASETAKKEIEDKIEGLNNNIQAKLALLDQTFLAGVESLKANRAQLVELFDAEQLRKSFLDVAQSAEQMEASMNKLNFNKQRFEFATLQVQTEKTIQEFGKMASVIKQLGTNDERVKTLAGKMVSEFQGLLQEWSNKSTLIARQLLDNQKGLLNKQRGHVQEMASFQQQLAAAARSIEEANRNVRSIQYGIAERANPIIEAQKAILELRTQQQQAIGDIVGFAQTRQKLLEKELETTEKLADIEKQKSRDARLSLADRIAAGQQEQQLRSKAVQLGSELQRMAPNSGANPEGQIDKIGKSAEYLQQLFEKQDRANKEVAEQNRQVRELDIKRIKEQANLAQTQHQMEVKKIAEERGMLEYQKSVADSQLEITRQFTLGLAALTGNKEFYDTMVKSFDEIDVRRKSGEEKAKQAEEQVLKAAGLSGKTWEELSRDARESTIRVDEFGKAIEIGKANIDGLNSGLLRTSEVIDIGIGKIEAAVEERIRQEKKLAEQLGNINIIDKITTESKRTPAPSFEEMRKSLSDIKDFMYKVVDNTSTKQNDVLIGQLSNFARQVTEASLQTNLTTTNTINKIVESFRSFNSKPVEISVNITSDGSQAPPNANLKVGFYSWNMTTDKNEKLTLTYGDLGLLPII